MGMIGYFAAVNQDDLDRILRGRGFRSGTGSLIWLVGKDIVC